MAPSLPAAQPATYTFEGREIRPLGKENDKAFALINALDEKQRGQAILGSRRRRPRARRRPGWQGHPAGRAPRLRDVVGAAGHAARDRPRVGRHHDRRVRRAAHGRDPRQPAADLLRVERPDDQRQRRLLPHPGADAGHRVRAAGQRRSHPHHLPRSDQRLRCEVQRNSWLVALALVVCAEGCVVCAPAATSTCRRRASPSIPIG